MIHRQFRGSRAAELYPVLAYEPCQQRFVLDDLSLGFGFVCEPLSSADHAQADSWWSGSCARASVLARPGQWHLPVSRECPTAKKKGLGFTLSP
ncbi:TraC family protein [uncultured Thiodictyon sp.]|uniref:TraC family protein n=1 Tax=uncultured Thiodictyon sp. TaxID=1846217 RepID=UPI0025F81ABE|nr:TraC family protein [uncultured Thiodictyon sp.]